MSNKVHVENLCSIVAAADVFQCLHDGRDTAPLIAWLEGAGQPYRPTQPRRTQQRGLLAAALAIKDRTTWNGPGFRLLDAPAMNANSALLSWSIANEIAQRHGPVAILTPDAGRSVVRASLNTIQTKQYTRKNGAAFGPYPQRGIVTMRTKPTP